MSEFFKWLSTNPLATTAFAITFAIVIVAIVLIYVIAFFQGREISFWPPKIGERPTSMPHARQNKKHISAYNKPTLITKEEKNSAIVLDSHLLKQYTGTIMFWVYLNEKDEGIRHLINNRYLVSHAKQIAAPYGNVFALSISPQKWGPPPEGRIWKLWLKGKNNIEEVWTTPDSSSVGQGWSHVAIRWDFNRYNRIEVIVNGHIIIQGKSPHKYWPNEFSPHIYFGTWPSKSDIHYIETSLSGIQMITQWKEDKDIQDELLNNNPDRSVS